MKLTIDTTPEQDAYLQSASDAANVGQGDHVMPPLEEFAVTFISDWLDKGAAALTAQTIEDAIEGFRQAAQADPSVIDALNTTIADRRRLGGGIKVQ